MKLHSEVIPKFIISLDKNKDRQESLSNVSLDLFGRFGGW